jgi:hypothetical protein
VNGPRDIAVLTRPRLGPDSGRMLLDALRESWRSRSSGTWTAAHRLSVRRSRRQPGPGSAVGGRCRVDLRRRETVAHRAAGWRPAARGGFDQLRRAGGPRLPKPVLIRPGVRHTREGATTPAVSGGQRNSRRSLCACPGEVASARSHGSWAGACGSAGRYGKGYRGSGSRASAHRCTSGRVAPPGGHHRPQRARRRVRDRPGRAQRGSLILSVCRAHPPGIPLS